MNVASLELCKELYATSGWDNTYWMYGAKGLKPRTVLFGSKPTPAYDLGYLRKKIYEQAPSNMVDVIEYNFMAALFHGEDATTRFAIDLFRRGILKKDRSTDGGA